MNGLKEKYKNPDWDRIAHLFKIGIFASLLALIGGDMVLGWGTVDMSLDVMEQYFSRYTDVSDVRIFWSWAYALSTGWLSFGSLVTFIGLLVAMPKARN